MLATVERQKHDTQDDETQWPACLSPFQCINMAGVMAKFRLELKLPLLRSLLGYLRPFSRHARRGALS